MSGWRGEFERKIAKVGYTNSKAWGGKAWSFENRFIELTEGGKKDACIFPRVISELKAKTSENRKF